MDGTAPQIDRAAPVVLARERPFRLGAVQVRPALRELVGPAGREILEPRVMQALVALARARGEIVTRDDLIESCWEGRIVSEDALSRVISRVRRASEGVGRDGWTLETITKVGYRLVPIDDVAEVAAPPLDAASAIPGARPGRRALLALCGAGVAAAAVGGVVWLRRPRVPERARLLYRKGLDAMGPGLPETNQQAQGFLRETVALAPHFAEGWGALALAYQGGLLFTPPARQPGVQAQAEAAAHRALELDPREPQATAALALLAPVWRNWLPAQRLYDRALSLHARDPQVEHLYARLLLSVGRLKESVPHAEASVAGDEFAVWHRHTLGTSLWAAGRVEEADQAVAKALAQWPRHYALWFLKLALLSYTGRADQALALGEDRANRPLNIPDADIELNLVGARALMTRAPADVRAAMDANLAAARKGAGYAENAMSLASALGLLDEAFALARALLVTGEPALQGERFGTGRFVVAGRQQTHHLFMPQTAAMRADPRFPALMREIGLTDYWRQSGHGPDDPRWAGAA